MTTETSKHPIPEISYSSLRRAAELSEANTRIERLYTDENLHRVRLRILEADLLLEADNPILLVAAMIDALAAKELIIENLQAQIDTLRPGGSDNG